MAAIAAMATLTWAAGAQAAAYSGLKHACSYRFGAGSYQSISFAGATSCAEARGLIADVTDNGRSTPTLGVSTGHTPQGIWRCLTERRVEIHGVIESSHRITCTLQDDPRGRQPRIRFFYES
jgi:hypothetical protein